MVVGDRKRRPRKQLITNKGMDLNTGKSRFDVLATEAVEAGVPEVGVPIPSVAHVSTKAGTSLTSGKWANVQDTHIITHVVIDTKLEEVVVEPLVPGRTPLVFGGSPGLSSTGKLRLQVRKQSSFKAPNLLRLSEWINSLPSSGGADKQAPLVANSASAQADPPDPIVPFQNMHGKGPGVGQYDSKMVQNSGALYNIRSGFGRVNEHIYQGLATRVTPEEVRTALFDMQPAKALGVDSKIVANRLKPLISSWVAENQTSFVSERSISDNVVLIQEVIHSMRRKRGEIGWMAIKLDLEKAYDRIEWPFIEDTDKANPRGLIYNLDHEIEKTQRDLKRRPADGQNLPAPADGSIVPPIPQNNQQQPVRTVCDYLAEDLEGLNPAVTIPEFEAKHFELKPVMFNMLNTLGQFGGSPAENARQHLKSFMEICNSFKIHGVSNDVLKLKLFPYSLRDKAKAWLNNLPPGSLQSWTKLCRSFLAKFIYTKMTDHLRNQITSFRQEDNEAMHEAWEHYRDLFRRCPMHGLPKWTQVSIFYNSVNTPTRMVLDASRRGTTRRGPTQLDSSDTILAQISALTNMVKNMQKQPNIQEVKALDAFCELCGNNHDASECGQTLDSSCYVGNYNKSTMSNTYNPAWRNHPNFSWKNQNNTLNPQQPNQQGF
ncbi:hypothetical protein GQ457_03G014760 [Hibiscus cannabinus]